MMKVEVKYWKNKGQFEDMELAITKTMEKPNTFGYETHNDICICVRMYDEYNSDFRPDARIRPSMSVGDIVTIEGKAYMCAKNGWVEL